MRRAQIQKFAYHVMMVLVAVAFGLVLMKYYAALSGGDYYFVRMFTLRTALALEVLSNTEGAQFFAGNIALDPGTPINQIRMKFHIEDNRLLLNEQKTGMKLAKSIARGEKIKLPVDPIEIVEPKPPDESKPGGSPSPSSGSSSSTSSNSAPSGIKKATLPSLHVYAEDMEMKWTTNPDDIKFENVCPVTAVDTYGFLALDADATDMLAQLKTIFMSDSLLVTMYPNVEDVAADQVGALLVARVRDGNNLGTIFVNEKGSQVGCRIQQGLFLAGFSGATVIPIDYDRYPELSQMQGVDTPLIFLDLETNIPASNIASAIRKEVLR